MDVRTAFLQGEAQLDEETHMKQPERYVDHKISLIMCAS